MIMKNKNIYSAIVIMGIVILVALSLQFVSAETSITNTTDGGIAKGINDAGLDDGILILGAGNYTGSNNTGILINQSVTIKGNNLPENVIIDAQGINYIFAINDMNLNVVFENITFTNGYTNNGGAIHNIHDRTNITVINCIFTNNFVTDFGGAIYNEYGDSFIINNSNFINNTALLGGAIFNRFDDNFSIDNSNFINNSAIYDGGAIHIEYTPNFIINNTNFTNNSAESGGVISSSYNDCTIVNSNFMNNSASYSGGVIISLYDDCTIVNSNFINNSASYSGGVISSSNNNLIINNSSFLNNSAEIGGAIYKRDTSIGKLIIHSSNFTNNSATYGGAIYIGGSANCTIDNSKFINNSAIIHGGAIYNYYSIKPIKPNPPERAFAEGISYNEYGYNLFINNTSFANNSAMEGGAIYNNAVNVTIINSIFQNNSADYFGGGIASYHGGDFIIIDSNFTKNTADDGGAIYNEDYVNLFILGCNFINNSNTIYVYSYPSDDVYTRLSNSDLVINYNRILNNTGYDLFTNNDINADFNWWGINNPDMDKIIGPVLNNYYVMDVLNLSSLFSNGTVKFQYSFVLNTGEDVDNSLLPYFTTDVYTNVTNGIVSFIDARFNNTFDVTVKASGHILYTFVTDNQVKTLEGLIKIDTNTTIIVQDTVKIPATSSQGNPINITGVLYDKNGNSISKANITVTVDGKTSNVMTDSIGRWTVSYTPTHVGNITIIAKFNGDGSYNPSENSTIFAVTKGKIFVNISVKDNPDGSITITANVTDDEGKPVFNYPVDFYMDGKNIGRQYTDVNGIATMTILGDGENHEFKVLVPEAEIDENSENTVIHRQETPKNVPDEDPDNPIINDPYDENPQSKSKISSANIAMKNTGIPIVMILLVLLSILGLFSPKK